MIVRTAAELGLLLRSRRRELGLDQRTLAERIGVSRLWIIEFERGKARAEIGLVMRALIALDLQLDVTVEAPAAPAPRATARGKTTAPPDIDAILQNARRKR
ncbi:MAG TPA: helix-turn-helix domain-containing protein [Labilithrix sp.]|nr:helix-turn-helix domain-containing protein [Labilithrix sp.]